VQVHPATGPSEQNKTSREQRRADITSLGVFVCPPFLEDALAMVARFHRGASLRIKR
jgi:hypothetical protein